MKRFNVGMSQCENSIIDLSSLLSPCPPQATSRISSLPLVVTDGVNDTLQTKVKIPAACEYPGASENPVSHHVLHTKMYRRCINQ